MFRKIILSCLLVTIAACSSTAMSEREQNEAYRDYLAKNNIESQDQIRSFKYSGWQSLTNSYLIISTRVSEKYLVELSNYCADLMFANHILINQRSRTTLMSKFDSIKVADSLQMKCQIKSIYPLTPEQVTEVSAIAKQKAKTNESDDKKGESK